MARIILKYCPQILHKNIDEIVNEMPLSEILFSFKAGGKNFTKTMNDICCDFYNNLPPIVILIGICLEIKGEYGFMWLHDLRQ